MFTKKALIRDQSVAAGQPAPMHLICVCGAKVDVPKQDRIICPKCNQNYDSAGYLIQPVPK
jgi:hypothetical protein